MSLMVQEETKTKVCTECEIELPLDQFYKRRSGADELRSRCKSCLNSYKRRYIFDRPWARVYDNIHSRCSGRSHPYFKKGIKMEMTMSDVKKLWKRDQAQLLERPSIDREDAKGNYSFGNCRFIELTENIRRAKINGRKSSELETVNK